MYSIQTEFADDGNVILPVSKDKLSIYEAANCTFDNLPETWSRELYAYPRYTLSEWYAQ